MQDSFKSFQTFSSKFSYKNFLPGACALVAIASLSQLAALADSSATKIAASVSADSKSEVCAVTCHEPHAACSESVKVIDTLNQLTQLINDGNFSAMADYFDDGVTTFNEDNKRLIIGKEAVMADLKERYALHHRTEGRLVSYTIDHPYAAVNGNRAVVTFIAKKVLAGEHPVEMESHSTEVFVKEGDKWKTLHYRGSWKKIS